jgi:hypothetical protein
MTRAHLFAAGALVIVAMTTTVAGQRSRGHTAPEAFTSQLQARTEAGAAASTIRIQIDRYSNERERTTMTDGMKHGGYGGFLKALRAAPAVGVVEMGEVKGTLRWAREQPTPKGRAISLVTDAPLYFVGGGRADAKPREGFEVAVLQIEVDENGLGTGTMAAAARVRPDGQGGVVLDDYAEQPIKLTFVHRVIK